ncbi:trypsin-like serine protease [Bdellovibrio sp. SKB1291214]|uniref:S1 family peptidase n=1 Tax=Bdellovibrio sp. SKB1291214 TaxID=1732569 RepID=UPI000B519071|nr:trypsin-like serine protease [Bdellovibrio sp. SKB1291214]UYL08943.1 trypsin-like serine protease [Bdellovibrio sp. SKB1291214]
MSRVLLVGLSLMAMASCTPNAGNVTSAVGVKIINGTEVQELDSIAPHLVAVYDSENMAVCTGTLIAPNIVLTAAHCISTKAQNLKVVFGLNMDEMLSAREPDIKDLYVHNVSAVKVHPKWNLEKNEEKANDWHDLAVLKFKGNAPEGFIPAEFLTDLNVLQPGVTAYVAGYGVNAVESRNVNADEKLLPGEESFCDEKGCVYVKFSGDGLLRWTLAPIATLEGTELRLDEQNSGTCGGDSGGPAFVLKDGRYQLFGVTSRGSLFCNSVGVYTIALKLSDFLKPAIESLQQQK